jgi:hypothetical protein
MGAINHIMCVVVVVPAQDDIDQLSATFLRQLIVIRLSLM